MSVIGLSQYFPKMRPLCSGLYIFAAIFGIVYCQVLKYTLDDAKRLRFGIQYISTKRDARYTFDALEPVFRRVYISMANMYNYHFASSKLPELPESGTGIDEDVIRNLDHAFMMLRGETERSVETRILHICIGALLGLIRGYPGISNQLGLTLSIAGQLLDQELIILRGLYDAAIGQRPVYMHHPINDNMHLDHSINYQMDHSINNEMDQDET
jgi:hypothetical protein